MAFNEQEKQLIIWGKQNGKSAEDIELAIAKLRAGIQPPVNPEPQRPVGRDVAIGAAKEVGSSVKGIQDMLAASVPSLLAGPIASAIPAVKDKINGLVQPLKDLFQKHLGLTDENLEADNDAQKVGKGLMLGAEIATPFVTAKLATIAPRLFTAGAEAVSERIPSVNKAVEKARDLINPKNPPIKALSQIAQAPDKSLSAVARTLQTVDTQNIKTYADFVKEIDTKIPDLARSVDTELAKDPTPYKLSQLATKQTTEGGKPVTTDFISRALQDLDNLYAATGDDIARANIKEIISHAKKSGLTRKEVNDISRVYGEEFGGKAFGKTGEPLTSTNAQAFENTRKGLKTVARQGLGGQEAQQIDQTLSALYDTRKLAQKNADAVARLQQRIQERGLVEKAGYYVSKYADILTGGSIRGFIGGVLPRGAGYKVMNPLDIENALRSNLDVIEKALTQKSDKDLLTVLKEADEAFKKSGPAKRSR